MAVQVWIGEKPEHPNERKAIIALANGLDRLEGLYVMLANFSVGGHTIDLVILKNDAVFIIEMKHCDGRVYGSVNGRWKVVSASGSVKWLNQGRKNPYNQVIAYYYAFRNFLHDHQLEIMSEQKASMTDLRACKRVIVIAPTLEDGSEISLDWRVSVKGLDEMPTFLVTERSEGISFTDQEMLTIPRLLNCAPWEEVNNLVAGVMPAWSATPADPPPPTEPEPVDPVVPEPVVPPIPLPWWQRLIRSRRNLVALLAWSSLALMILFILVRGPNIIVISNATEVPVVYGTLPVPQASATPSNCVATYGQTIRKERDPISYTWRTIDPRDSDKPSVAVTLDQVDFCPNQIIVHWSVQNSTAGVVQLGLTNNNIKVSDTSGVNYRIVEERATIRVRNGKTGSGIAVIRRAVSPNATTLTIELIGEPFGRQMWTIQVPRE